MGFPRNEDTTKLAGRPARADSRDVCAPNRVEWICKGEPDGSGGPSLRRDGKQPVSDASGLDRRNLSGSDGAGMALPFRQLFVGVVRTSATSPKPGTLS